MALAALFAILLFYFLLLRPTDNCSSDLYLSGRSLSLETAVGELDVKAKSSPAAQQEIDRKLQALAHSSSQFCRMHKQGAISDKQYLEEIQKITEWYKRLSEAVERGQLAAPNLTRTDLDAIVFRTLTQPEGGVTPFLLFFGWNESEVSPAAAESLKAVRDRCRAFSKEGRKFVVSIEGHSDGSELEELKRLPPIQQYIGRKTISAARIASTIRQIRGSGEDSCNEPIVFTDYESTRPLVPVAPGVREPQNRRTEVLLKPAI